MSRAALRPSLWGTSPALHYAHRVAEWLAVERRRQWVLVGFYILLAVNLFTVGLYLFHGYQTYFHGDSSTKNLLAQEIWETGQFFPRDWNYVNGDLLVVFGHLLILPLLPFFKNGFALHAFAGLLFSVAILGTLWRLTSLTCEHRWQRVAIVAVLAGGVSWNIAENVFGQVSYGVVLLLSTLVVILGCQVVRIGERVSPVPMIGLAVVVFLATWSNPQRALMYYILPLFVALGASAFTGPAAETTKRLRRAALAVLIACVGVAAGVVCSSMVLAMVENNHGAAAARWLDFNGIVRNLVQSVNAGMAMLGGLPVTGSEVATVAGAYACLRMAAGFVALTALPCALARALHAEREGLRFLAAFAAAQLSLILFLFVATTIPDMNDPVNSGRYLVPPIVLALVVLFSLPLSRRAILHSAVVLGLICVLATNSVVRLGREALPVRAHNEARTAVLEALKAKGLRYGYATYWNAGPYTVLSGGDVRIRQVTLPDGIPMPMRHLSSNRWYEPGAWRGATFLLLDDAEADKVDWDAMKTLMGTEPERLQAGGLIAFIYPANLAEKIPLWSRTFDRPLELPAAPGSMRNQGEWDEDRKAVVSLRGQAGFLAFGPYMHLPQGRYRADFKVEVPVDTEGREAAIVDVVKAGGASIIASSHIRGPAAGIHQLEFELPEPAEQLEVRVRATGEAEVVYRGVVLHPDGQPQR